MSNTLKVSRYLLKDSSKALIIFYSIITLIGLLLTSIFMSSSSADKASFGGFGMSSSVFLFVTALNMFKVNYKFMQSFNISRKRFYMASIVALITLAFFMSILDIILNNGFNLLTTYEGLYEKLYASNLVLNDFIWSFALFTYVASLGWFITLLYYRCNKIMKVVVSIMPVLAIIIISMIDKITSVDVWISTGNFLSKILGFANGFNSHTAVVTFFIGATICFSLSFLLITRAVIKD